MSNQAGVPPEETHERSLETAKAVDRLGSAGEVLANSYWGRVDRAVNNLEALGLDYDPVATAEAITQAAPAFPDYDPVAGAERIRRADQAQQSALEQSLESVNQHAVTGATILENAGEGYEVLRAAQPQVSPVVQPNPLHPDVLNALSNRDSYRMN